MNPQSPNPTNPLQTTEPNPLAVMQKGEREIFHIKRHPIGLIMIYAVCALLLLALAVVFLVVLPEALPNQKDSLTAIGLVGLLLTGVFMVLVAYVANRIYWGNSWTLTSDSLTQVRQTSLFNKHRSQLSLENIEDVTAEKNGILTHVFNYGVLKCETAGEHSKFIFLFCPNPDNYAQQVLQAREQFHLGKQYSYGDDPQPVTQH